MKKAVTTFFLIATMSFMNHSFSQNSTYYSQKNTQCSWNEQTQLKDLCRESLNNVQIEINRTESRVFITTDGNISVFRIEEEKIVSNPVVEFKLTSADGTSWEMNMSIPQNKIWMDMLNSKQTDAISYLILN